MNAWAHQGQEAGRLFRENGITDFLNHHVEKSGLKMQGGFAILSVRLKSRDSKKENTL